MVKRNIIVAFFLIGLVALEYGCKKDPAPEEQCNTKEVKTVTGVSGTFLLEEVDNRFQELESMDTVSFENLVIRNQLVANFVKHSREHSNYSALALAFVPDPLCWDLSAIQILGQIGSETYDFTSEFVVSSSTYNRDKFGITNDDAFRNTMREQVKWAPGALDMFWVETPPKFGQYHFTIKYTNTNGTEFEAVTLPIIITR